MFPTYAGMFEIFKYNDLCLIKSINPSFLPPSTHSDLQKFKAKKKLTFCSAITLILKPESEKSGAKKNLLPASYLFLSEHFLLFRLKRSLKV